MNWFKAFLENADGKSFGKSKDYVTSVEEHISGSSVEYKITLSPAAMKRWQRCRPSRSLKSSSS